MEWTETIKETIDYLEQHMLDEIKISDLSKQVAVSPFYLQKGFALMTGITMGEYIRNRRLYMAAVDLIMHDDKIIDTALKYGYESPESFTRAFTRFHQISPTAIKKEPSRINTYLPLQISILIKGGNAVDYVVEKMDAFQMIGFKKSFSFDNAFEKIPVFWKEFANIYMQGKGPKGNQELVNINNIGEFGISMDNNDPANFDYLIVGILKGSELIEDKLTYLKDHGAKDITIVDIPAMEWARFHCVGPIVASIQALNTRIYTEWLPGNKEYDITGNVTVEWYPSGDTTSSDYVSEMWIPVKRK